MILQNNERDISPFVILSALNGIFKYERKEYGDSGNNY